MRYNRRHLSSLLNLLYSARAKWWDIGLQLGFTYGELASIRHDYPGNAQRCLAEVINKWLTSGTETTSEKLALALSQPSIQEMDLVRKITPSNQHYHQPRYSRLPTKNSFWKILPLVLLTCLGILVYTSESKSGFTLSLPVIKEKLVGRDGEMQDIMGNLSLPQVEVVNIYGLPGVGKSTLAIHIGHAMLNKGINVHYIFVEDLHDINALEKKLFRISEHDKHVTLMEWARNIKKKTFLILDNVNGKYWDEYIKLTDLSKFIHILQSYSYNINVLITSQSKLHGLTLRYQPYRLGVLNDENCKALLKNTITGNNLENSQASEICALVGGIPLIITILAQALSSSAENTTPKVIEKLNSTYKLSFIADQGNREFNDKFLHTLERSYNSISKECQKFTLFLEKLGSFTLDMARHFLPIKNSKTASDATVHTEDCIKQLSNVSFVEETSITGQKGYRFYAIVRSYLQSKRINDAVALKLFWKNNYFYVSTACDEIQSDEPKILCINIYKGLKLTEEYIKILSSFIKHLNYETVVHLTRHIYIYVDKK